ncbi:similar to Saccharomyces cerevisiae YIL132C CSM2 Protein involved in a Rad51p- [Maudiozyma saulgeensis]|uniref:Similar to Saccharomyces cerevisiae YIL132C CSM2 Protein involved in a Rad51p n=1 Tax=Maudiozyma saulgeensis TaxID=1789683 RepID=A0A1X7R410_9SACH|nr:similar to Saccharomyces cerevisiae YIL132C CSM2 Protein involved in a Rad51p- [Kazachstania saulgeensis]
MQKYGELPNILLWKSFNKVTLAKGLCDYIITNRNVHNTETKFIMKKLYYIDSVNSFPLEDFKRMIPINMPINKSIYDNVIINQALNLKELNEIIMKIIQSEKQAATTEEKRIIEKPSTSQENLKDNVLIVINGLDIMFQNSSMSDSRQAHNHLNLTLLQLRATANRGQESFKSIILSRDPLNGDIATQQFKRTKNEGNSVYQYVSKYYADYNL